MSETVFAPVLNLVWRVITEQKLDAAAFIREAVGDNVDLEIRHNPNARVALRDVEKIWTRLEEVTGDECLGLKYAGKWHPSHLGGLGYAWLASSSLRTAFDRLSRYIRMVNEGVSISVEETAGEYAVVVQHLRDDTATMSRHEATTAIVIDMCRVNAGNDFSPLRVEFSYRQPACVSEYYAFFRCPLSFNSERTCLIFTQSQIGRHLPGSNPKIAEISDRTIIEYLARMDKTDIISRAKAEIIKQLPSGGVTDEMVSGALHMSERSLQRALQNKNISFKKLLTDTRQELARKYLNDSSLSLTEISFMLGFSEMSAFSRAYKHWTGKTPSQHRR